VPPLPPFHQFRDFLPEDELATLLNWTIAHRARFAPSRMSSGIVDPSARHSLVTTDFGEIHPLLTSRIEAALPKIFTKSGTRPFAVEAVELEIAAHGDGAHFAPHTDIPVGPGTKPIGGDRTGVHDRIVSAVLYYHREPKCFSGGELRLHRFGSDGGPGDFVDIEPEQNSLVVFPSWAQHEVRQVRAPGAPFEDSRFAVNCWLCRKLR
jgi:Rps23 Pro-64 3,4-dihydroxylase Tpa1-like proline 4-hydroxylase